MQTLTIAEFSMRLGVGVGCGALIGIERQPRHDGGERGGVAGGKQNAGPVLLDEFRNSADVAAARASRSQPLP